MKELKKIFVVELIAFWVIYALLMWCFYAIAGKPVDFLTILLGLVIAFIFVAINTLTIYSLLKPKLNFLESDDKTIPAFGNKTEKIFTVERSDFSFEVVKYKIKEHYHIVLYDNAEQYLIKFHSGISLFSWGVAGVVAYDAVTRAITITCFPMSAYTDKAAKATQTTVDKVESLITSK